MKIKKICISLLAGSLSVLATVVTVFSGLSVNNITQSVKNCVQETYDDVVFQTKTIVAPIQKYFAAQDQTAIYHNGQPMPYILPNQQNYIKYKNYQDQVNSQFLCANSGILIKANLATLEEILRFSEYRGSG